MSLFSTIESEDKASSKLSLMPAEAFTPQMLKAEGAFFTCYKLKVKILSFEVNLSPNDYRGHILGGFLGNSKEGFPLAWYFG